MRSAVAGKIGHPASGTVVGHHVLETVAEMPSTFHLVSVKAYRHLTSRSEALLSEHCRFI